MTFVIEKDGKGNNKLITESMDEDYCLRVASVMTADTYTNEARKGFRYVVCDTSDFNIIMRGN